MTGIRIGGLQPITASDFPGCVATIVFTQGCNFRCPFCHNHGLLTTRGENELSTEQLFAFLEKRRRLLGGVVISGGEPCLHSGLAAFCARLKDLGLAVKLDSNGSQPERLENLLEAGLLDFIAMDIKAPPARLADLTGGYDQAETLQASIELIAASGIRHLFRTTDVAPLLSRADLDAIRKLVPPGSPHIVQPFIAENALDPRLRQPYKPHS